MLKKDKGIVMFNKNERKYCVYFHINSFTEEVFYVGIGTIKRPMQNYKRSDFWKNYVKKYGFKFKIIEDGLCWSEACALEKHFISHFGRKDIGTGLLINQTDGGDGTGGYASFWKGKKRPSASEETIKKCKENTARFWLGKSIPSEVKDKISKTLKGTKPSNETIEKLKKRIPWNRGKKGVQVSTRKGVKTGKTMPLNTREALKKANTGRKMSEDVRLLMSKIHKGKVINAEVREKIRKTLLKRNHE
jgi:NUMOD3 motif-containing protein